MEALARIERRLLPLARRVIVTSPHTVADLAAYQVPQARIGVVLPGTDPAPLARGSGGPGLALLCVASLTPRKGHLILLEALAELLDLDWHLTCVGSLERDPPTAQAIGAAIARLGLDARVSLVGEQDEAGLAPLYDRADLFVLASYHEGYGMALAEALARGLPIVATKAGAIPGTVPPSAGHAGRAGRSGRPRRRAAPDHDRADRCATSFAPARRASASACRAGPMPCAALRRSSIEAGA